MEAHYRRSFARRSLLSSLSMDALESTARDQVRCDGCGQATPGYDIVNYGAVEREYRRLCSRCFNTEIANAAGLQGFEQASFEPVGLTDCRREIPGGADLMYGAWLANEHSRIHLIERWTESPRG